GVVGCSGVGAGGSAPTGVTVRSEIAGVDCCASGRGDGSVCACLVCCAGGEGAEVVDGTDRAGAWFGGNAVGCWTGCVGDTMATFHLNGSSCGASWICFTSRIAAKATVPCKRMETSQPWTGASLWLPELCGPA